LDKNRKTGAVQFNPVYKYRKKRDRVAADFYNPAVILRLGYLYRRAE
jgi:hypothetical protein